MQGWVGMKPLRVQALMTKLQTQRTQIDDLERQLASVQNQLNWEILSKGDIDQTLQRARTKIKRRRELLENVERLMRESIDEFHAADKLKTEQKSALEYWSSLGKGAATAVAGLSSLAIAGKDALWNKVGSIFQTGGYGGNSIPEMRVWYKMDTNPMKDKFKELINGGSSYTEIPSNLIVSTPDPVQRKLDVQDVKNLATKATGIINGINGSIGKFSAKKEELWNEFQENRQQEVADARERGLQGEKPDGMLLYTNYKAYSEQLEAWKSTLSEEELAAYEAYLESLEEEEEEEKNLWDTIGDKLGEAKEAMAGGFTAAGEFVGDRVDDAKDAVGGWVDNQVEDFKTNWEGLIEDGKEVISNVNDFVDEHPEIKYAAGTIGNYALSMADVVAGTTAFSSGNIVLGVAKLYTASNSLLDSYQDAVALGNQEFGYMFRALGKNDDADFHFELAETNAGYNGFTGVFKEMGEDDPVGKYLIATFETADTAASAVSIVGGISSLYSNIGNIKSVADLPKCYFNWKTSDGSVLSNADQFYSNASTIYKTIKGIGEENGFDVVGSMIKPVGIGVKIAKLIQEKIDEEE